MMMVSELSRIDKTIEIAAPPERVWRALTNAVELSQWFRVTIEGEIAPGQEVWMTSVHAEHTGQRFRVRFAEMTPPSRLVWQWHPGAVDSGVDYSAEPRTTVTFTLEPSDRGTRLSVAETGFDQIPLARRAKVYEDNTQGWTEVLVWLQRHVEAAG
ncbi:MAG: SRPBCC family protein [Acidobacteria bacterium]|nr:SRPBCC family protein [Acidobacteriota bacterium]